MSDWYYATGGERFGPMTLGELNAAAGDGRLKPADKAWSDGWPEWRPATDVPGLNFPGRAGGEVPARAAATLNGHAKPGGDTTDWPLDAPHVEALADAVRHRRRVLAAAAALRLLALVHLIIAALMGVLAAARGQDGQTDMRPVAIVVLVAVVAAIVYLLAARGVRRGRVPMAGAAAGLIGLTLIGCGVGLWAAVRGGASERAALALLVTLTLVLLWGGGRVVRGIGGAKRFRASPAWCQEPLVAGETRAADA